MKTWLIIDSSSLCWRLHYAIGNLDNGVIFGVLRDIPVLYRKFRPDSVAWCFDKGASLRSKVLPIYKSARKSSIDPVTAQDKVDTRNQIDRLRTEILPRLGYKNLFWQDGYESDDLIAQTALYVDNKTKDEAVIVSGDKDLYQCLSPMISLWNFKKLITAETFEGQYGISPYQWRHVKAIAGCTSDQVPGISGVGEISALKFLKKDPKLQERLSNKIEKGKIIWDRNLPLVSLPYQGTMEITLTPDELSPKEWLKVCEELSMESIKNQCPVNFERRLI